MIMIIMITVYRTPGTGWSCRAVDLAVVVIVVVEFGAEVVVVMVVES